MSANAEAGGGNWEDWPPRCETLVSEIQTAWDDSGLPSGKYCGVQVHGDGDSIRHYRVELLSHERDTSDYPPNWPPRCPDFIGEIENEWKNHGKPHGTSCVVMIDGVNPISGYRLVCHTSPG